MTGPPTEDFNWGLIGYGDLAEKRVAAALRTAAGSRLVGHWGRDHGRARAFAGRHQIPQVHPTLESLLASGIAAVYVCTPPASHAPYALAALAAGKHVLVEKPMATSVRECEQMIAAAAGAHVTLGVAYYRRVFPKMQRIRALIGEGLLGVPTWVNISSHSWFNPSGHDPKRWRVQLGPSGGAGALADIGLHRLDLLEYWLGPSEVVFSDLHRLVHSYEVEDGAAILLKLANGAPVQGYFAWNSHTWLDRFEITGTEGKIIAEPLDGESLSIIRGRQREEVVIASPINPHLPLVEDFVQAVRERRAPICDGKAGLQTNRLLAESVRKV